MEFKDRRTLDLNYALKVLIESDWNLKEAYAMTPPVEEAVLIESDWNLKQGGNKKWNLLISY